MKIKNDTKKNKDINSKTNKLLQTSEKKSKIDIRYETKEKAVNTVKNKSKKSKMHFLFNPDDPKKSFDVYTDKNPHDTISIKYTTLEDVKHTIKKLERLYRKKEYPHKRIWQVSMIMMVRLRVLKRLKLQQYKLAYKYNEFLGKRTKAEESERRKMKFVI